ncbi:MAG: DUF615 domain-containing protein [Proteobacteria bacterium]|nr:DUF615 domain-containing protein [Pseudomonadota bacterium]
MNPNDLPQDELASKTQRKKDALALQELGQQLTRYSQSQLQELPLTERVVDAIEQFNRLPNSYGARKRQLQYIGRLMRDCDYEAISTALHQLLSGKQESNHEENTFPDLCERILQGGDEEINSIVGENNYLERQTLRTYFLEYSKGNAHQQQKIRQKLLRYLQSNIA